MNTLNDLRPTYVLRKYSTTLLLAALLDAPPSALWGELEGTPW